MHKWARLRKLGITETGRPELRHVVTSTRGWRGDYAAQPLRAQGTVQLAISAIQARDGQHVAHLSPRLCASAGTRLTNVLHEAIVPRAWMACLTGNDTVGPMPNGPRGVAENGDSRYCRHAPDRELVHRATPGGPAHGNGRGDRRPRSAPGIERGPVNAGDVEGRDVEGHRARRRLRGSDALEYGMGWCRPLEKLPCPARARHGAGTRWRSGRRRSAEGAGRPETRPRPDGGDADCDAEFCDTPPDDPTCS